MPIKIPLPKYSKQVAMLTLGLLVGALAFYLSQKALASGSSLGQIVTTLSSFHKVWTGAGLVASAATTFATVFGIIMGWRTLSQQQKTITDFPKLINKLCDMADESSSEQPLQILAYTPALGYLAEPH
ncbi:MAG TPA: hypothetical protein DC047_06605 [Blastocatellia bacterium]|nr:hypothetical protein [Blastocatellia bacterium]